MHEEVSPLFVFLRFPGQNFIRRIHQPEAPRLGGRRANQSHTPTSTLREILAGSLKPWLGIIGNLAILVILQRIFLSAGSIRLALIVSQAPDTSSHVDSLNIRLAVRSARQSGCGRANLGSGFTSSWRL